MATLDSPSKATIAAEVDLTNAAVRTSLRPMEHIGLAAVAGGHYRIAAKTGAATVIAAAGSIFSMRWTDSARIMVVSRIWVGFNITTAFTTAQVVDLDLIAVRGFTASDSGGTTITIGQGNKKRTIGMNNSLVGDVRIATTAALTNGTGTADANQMGLASCGPMNANNAVGAYSPMVPLLDTALGQEYPLVIAPSEGFRIRLATTMGAVGVGNFSVVVDWCEAPAF